MSGCGDAFFRQTIARRRTAWLPSLSPARAASARTWLTTPGWSRESASSATSAEPRHAGLSSSSPRRSSSVFWRNRNWRDRAVGLRADAEVRVARRHLEVVVPLEPQRRRAPSRRRPRASSSAFAAASASVKRCSERARFRADVARRRPEEPPGALLLEDVRRPAGDARAGEHRGRERRRDLRDCRARPRSSTRRSSRARARDDAPGARASATASSSSATSMFGAPSSFAVRFRTRERGSSAR